VVYNFKTFGTSF